MTQYTCDRCNKPMLHLPNGSDNVIVTLCSKCAEKEALRDPSLLSEGWDKLKVGAFSDIVHKGKTYTCEVMKARYSYVNIKVTENHEPFGSDYIVLVRNYAESRIDFYLKRFRYSFGLVARDFLLVLLLAEHRTNDDFIQMGSSQFLEAIKTVGGIDQ